MGYGAQASREAECEGFGRARLLIDDALQAFASEQTDHRFAAGEAAILRQRGPVGITFVFGEAIAVLAGVAHGRAIYTSGHAAAHVSDQQLQGASDGGVGAVALAERVHPRVHTDTLCDLAVDDHHR